MQNATAAGGNLDSDCLASYPADEQWHCFMAQYTLPHIKTRYFIVNSLYDSWQTSNIVGLSGAPSKFTDGPYPPAPRTQTHTHTHTQDCCPAAAGGLGHSSTDRTDSDTAPQQGPQWGPWEPRSPEAPREA